MIQVFVVIMVTFVTEFSKNVIQYKIRAGASGEKLERPSKNSFQKMESEDEKTKCKFFVRLSFFSFLSQIFTSVELTFYF